MNELASLDLTVSNSINILSFIWSIIGVAILCYLVALQYERYFPHISRSQSMNKTILTVGIITFLIISVVKSSLALSLGLVGALSIIRFRTPIKEPFELSYLFMSISIGLGFGANQYLPTTIVTLFVLIILSVFNNKISKINTNTYFFYITIPQDIKTDIVEKNISELSKNKDFDIYLKRLDQGIRSTQLTLNIKVNSEKELLEVNNKLKKIFSPESVSIVDSQKLMPF
jgi:hypothetical protein